MAIKDRLKYKVGKKKTFELMEEAAKKSIPAVQLMQDTFSDILEGVEEEELRDLKRYIGNEILKIMESKGYKKIDYTEINEKGMFNNGSIYEKVIS